jgi:hypothetical protein
MLDVHFNTINVFIISGGIISLSFSTVAAVMIQRRTTDGTGLSSASIQGPSSTQSDTHTNRFSTASREGHDVDGHEGAICSKRRRLATPYRRLIFALCSSDILQSVAFILGPFLVPRGSDLSSPWGLGTVSSCDMDGLLIIFGSTVSCMYISSMCIYYFCKTVKDMSDQDFYEKIEQKLHWFILLFNLPLSIAAVCTKSINPVAHLGFCHFSRMPIGCDPSIPGDCIRGEYASLFALLHCPLGIPVLCLLITFFCTIKVVSFYSSGRQERTLFQKCSKGRNDERMNIQNVTPTNGNEELHDLSDDEALVVAQKDHMSRLLQREAIGQLLWHMLVFVFVYGVHIGGTILRTFLPSYSSLSELNNRDTMPKGILAAIYLTSIVRPLGGFFNVLVCVRPQLLLFRRMHPNQSWIQTWWIFLKKGGKVFDRRHWKSSICSSSAAREICCCCIWSKQDDGMDISPVLRQIVEMQMNGEKQYVSRPIYSPETMDEEVNSAMSGDVHHQRNTHNHCQHDDKKDCVNGLCSVHHSLDAVKPAFSLEENEIVTRAFARALERATGLKDKCFTKEHDTPLLQQNDFVAKAFAKAFERVEHIVPAPQQGNKCCALQQKSESLSGGGGDHDSSQMWSERDSIGTSQLSSFQVDHDLPWSLFSTAEENNETSAQWV